MKEPVHEHVRTLSPELIGVYRIPFSLKTLRGAEEAVPLAYDGIWRWLEALRTMTRVVCVEMWVDTTPADFAVEWFQTTHPDYRDDNCQVPYDERWLTADGACELQSVPSGARCRLAFFLHEVGEATHLWTPWKSSFPLAPKRRMPRRLRRLMEYEYPT
jgi:hypothetical protein